MLQLTGSRVQMPASFCVTVSVLTDFVQGGGAVFCALRFVGGEEDWVCGGIQDAYA